MYIIARDGSGDFTSIQAALDQIPDSGRAPTILLIRMDTYREQVVVRRDNVRLIGEARDRTVLDGQDDAVTLKVTGRNVEIENLTILSGIDTAVQLEGDRATLRNCCLTGRKNSACLLGGRSYFEACRLQGDEVLVSGRGKAWLENCTLTAAPALTVCSAATPGSAALGQVFHGCTLPAEPDVCLARPGVRAAFLECRHPSESGNLPATRWETRSDSECFPRAMTEEEVLCTTVPEQLGGWDGWRPDRHIPTWFLCGDSTMANYGPKSAPMTGWGQKLQALLPETIHVENCAVNGRSSKSFIAEKRLNLIELCMRPGDKLVICFGHNDEKTDRERSTHPRITYPEYLTMYVDAARRQGAEPILVTSIARRHFNEAGQLMATHGDYPAAVRDLAGRLGVRLVDLELATMKLFQELGVEGTKAMFCHVEGHPNYPNGVSDNSHLQERGATRVAALFLDLLKGKQAGMAKADQLQKVQGSLDQLMTQEDRLL